MEEELEIIFELGRHQNQLNKWIFLLDKLATVETTGDVSTESCKGTYVLYRAYAKKLGINLPDKPYHEVDKTTFYRKQIEYVGEYLFQQKNTRCHAVYAAGDCIHDISCLIIGCRELSDQTSQNQLAQTLSEKIDNLKKTARRLEVDVSDEASQLNVSLNNEDLETLEHKLKMKFIRGSVEPKRSEVDPKRSEVDPTRIIMEHHWVISLVRLPDRSQSEHAFLVLEGKSHNKSMIWFADFVAKDDLDLLRPGMRDGKVRIDYHESKDSSGCKLLFQCCRKMMDIGNGDRLLYSTWLISKPTAEKLINNIELLQQNPPKYNILGNSVLAASSAASSSNPTGHNCFTFAKMLLDNLNDDYIVVPQDTIGKWVLSATSRNLPDKLLDEQWWNGVRFAMFTLLTLAVIAYLCSMLL